MRVISPVEESTVEILTTSASSEPKLPKRRKASAAKAESEALRRDKEETPDE